MNEDLEVEEWGKGTELSAVDWVEDDLEKTPIGRIRPIREPKARNPEHARPEPKLVPAIAKRRRG